MNQHALDQLVDAISDRLATRLRSELADALAAAAKQASPWMSIDSAAAYLDLPKARLYKLTAQGAIPHYKQDGRLLFQQGELDEWLAQFRQSADWISAANRAISR